MYKIIIDHNPSQADNAVVYEHIGELKNYWRHHSKIFLRKRLKGEEN